MSVSKLSEGAERKFFFNFSLAVSEILRILAAVKQ